VHGAGCAEIVHDMAPDAELYLAHDNTESEFYTAVDWLIAQDVAVVSYSCGWVFPAPHDGAGLPYNPVNAKIEEARAAGILWVNSAGNAGEDDTYQGAFDDPGGDNWHDFDGYFANGWGWLQAGSSYYSVLCWNDWPVDPTVSGSGNDYDLYLWRWDGFVWQQVASSNNPQTGSPGELPCEEIEFAPAVDDWYWLGVWRVNADGLQFLDLRKDSAAAFTVNNPEYSVNTPAESPANLAVGAVHWSSTALEPFSSRGPTLGPGGAPVGGLLKPDLVAADAVSTVSYGPSNGQPWLSGTGFFGTSAACPHVAGGAALLLEENPALDADALEALLLATAVDMGPAGPDNDYGAGMMVLEASLIFADGFESGDTTRWGSTSP
jgi:subtilisin family serine protease